MVPHFRFYPGFAEISLKFPDLSLAETNPKWPEMWQMKRNAKSHRSPLEKQVPLKIRSLQDTIVEKTDLRSEKTFMTVSAVKMIFLVLLQNGAKVITKRGSFLLLQNGTRVITKRGSFFIIKRGKRY